MKIDVQNPTPLYIQIAEDLKSEISQGNLKVGEKLDSQINLARKYDVSLITIKKALSDLIKEGVLYSRVGKGTYVSKQTPNIDFTKNKAIGLVLSDLKNPFFSLIVQSIEERASQEGYSILLSSSSERKEKEEKQIQHFREIGVDGLIVASITHHYSATPMIRKIHMQKFPYVVVSYIEDPDIIYVGTNHEKGAFLATEHLLKLGYNRIGYIGAEPGNKLSELRRHGYLRALRQYNKPYDPKLVFLLKWNNYQSGYEIGQRIGKVIDEIDAVFVFSDISALGFEQAILDQNMKVPGDIAIVGFDDIKRDLYAPVPLTTVHQPTDEIGVLAFDILLKRINNLEVPVKSILEPSLTIRSSCGWQTHTDII